MGFSGTTKCQINCITDSIFKPSKCFNRDDSRELVGKNGNRCDNEKDEKYLCLSSLYLTINTLIFNITCLPSIDPTQLGMFHFYLQLLAIVFQLYLFNGKNTESLKLFHISLQNFFYNFRDFVFNPNIA